jgi:hypothetical protein
MGAFVIIALLVCANLLVLRAKLDPRSHPEPTCRKQHRNGMRRGYARALLLNASSCSARLVEQQQFFGAH